MYAYFLLTSNKFTAFILPHAGFARTGNTYADTHEHVCGRRESFIKKFPLKSVTAGGPVAARGHLKTIAAIRQLA